MNGESEDIPNSPVEESKQHLYEKLCDVMDNLGYIQKRGQMKVKDQLRFTYLRALEIRNAIRGELASRKIWPICECLESQQREVEIVSTDYQTKQPIKKTEVRTWVKMKFGFINAEDPSQRDERLWFGWAYGNEDYRTYGGYTGAQRHFLELAFLLITDDLTPEAFAQQEANFQERTEQLKQRLSEKVSSTIPGAKRVGTMPEAPTAQELLEYDVERPPDNLEDPWQRKDRIKAERADVEDDDLSVLWRTMQLTAHPELEKRYPGKHVGDLRLDHLIKLNQGFVSKVINREKGFLQPVQNALSNALIARLNWEVDHGNVTCEQELDGKMTYTIVKRNDEKHLSAAPGIAK